jgi:hypothetical protein
MPTPVRSAFRDILLSLAPRLVAKGVVADASRVLIVARRKKTPHFAAVQDVLVRPAGFRVQIPWADTEGRVGMLIRRTILLTPRTRMELDQADQDIDLLTDASLGHFVFEEAIINALHLYQPLDGAGDALTIEPMHLTQGDDAAKEDEKSQGWGYATLNLEASYFLAVDQADQ